MPTEFRRSLSLSGLVRMLADAELVALGIGEHGPDESGHFVLTYGSSGMNVGSRAV